MSLHDRVAAFIAAKLAEFERDPGEPLRDDTPLIESGFLDSLALLQLAVWIEDEVGTPLDLTRVDVPHAWNTIRGIVSCIEQLR